MLEWSTKWLFVRSKTVILVQNGVNSDAMVAEFWSFATFYNKKGRMKKSVKNSKTRESRREQRDFVFSLSLEIDSD